MIERKQVILVCCQRKTRSETGQWRAGQVWKCIEVEKSKHVRQNLKKFSIPYKSYQHDSKIFHHSPSCKSNCWSYRQGEKIWMQCGHKTGGAVIRNRPVVVTKPIPNKGGSTPPKHPPSSSATYLSGWESKRRR